MININDIQFVIVLYNETLNNSESFQTVTKSLNTLNITEKASLFVYDNSPIPQKLEEYEQWSTEYINDPKNSGLSKAYNCAAEYASQNNKKWLFLLDQDTEFPENALELYLRAMNKYESIYMFVPVLNIENGKIMSPFISKHKWGRFAKTIDPGIHYFNKTSPVNSGLCVRLDKFDEVGGYNENVKVDGADFQFIERYKRKFSSYYVLDVQGFQNFSLFESDINKVIKRYKIFLADVKRFETHETTDIFFYHLLALKRTTRLFLDTKKIIFFKIFFSNYIFNRK
ncbi:Glycosyltransferase, GT2 family [Chryseobacterium ureilyticum]|uniref:Glycosyltransferase, GT2 family n=1 Tax=Chryseobacterium ureilyticum TaxID=373668 RepID=A0A1N7LX33_9FLAO|nr:glycosyltransferase [Chryseobacterium ureilyticum]SIS78339.1 Glycosyltransferase, GT2 family [Chryseobacterium ureilyticum]